MKGIDVNFDERYSLATEMELNAIKVLVLHINHLIANKKAVGRPTDQLDVINLEKIQKLCDEEK